MQTKSATKLESLKEPKKKYKVWIGNEAQKNK